jgi:hypothetical protein
MSDAALSVSAFACGRFDSIRARPSPRTVHTIVELLHSKRSLRLEWSIVILIVIEIKIKIKIMLTLTLTLCTMLTGAK